jgi:hypothetical protein
MDGCRAQKFEMGRLSRHDFMIIGPRSMNFARRSKDRLPRDAQSRAGLPGGRHRLNAIPDDRGLNAQIGSISSSWQTERLAALKLIASF